MTPAVREPVEPTLNDRLDLLLSRRRAPTPVPLYVLGGLAVLLLTAGAGGLVAGRRQARPR